MSFIVLHISEAWFYVLLVNVVCAQGDIIQYQYKLKRDPCFNNHQYDQYDGWIAQTSCPTFETTIKDIYYKILSFRSNFKYNPSVYSINQYALSLRIIDNQTELSDNDFAGLFQGRTILVLDLSYNYIQKIHPGTFISFSELLELSLSMNLLTTLDNYFFPLRELQKVNISRNSINIITDDAFVNQLDLFVIDLSFNNISHIPKNTFANQKYLEELLLQGNRIKQFNLNFPDGANLKLDLSYNLLETASLPEHVTDINQSHNNLTVFSTVVSGKLESLDLSYNYIKTIDPSSFMNAIKLSKLDLSHNLLTAIPTSSFKEVKKLQYLDISHNLIHENSYSSDNNWFSFFLNFKELSQVALDRNYWKCSDLKEFIYLLTSNRVEISQGSTHNTTNINGISCTDTNNTTTSTNQEITYNPSEKIQSLINQQVTEEFKNLYFNYTTLLALQTNESKVIMESLSSVKAEILKLKLALNTLNTTFNATEIEQQKGFNQKVKEEILKLKVTVNETDIEPQKNFIEKVKDEILQLKLAINNLNTTFNATEIEQQKGFSQRAKEEILKLKVTVNETDIEQQKNLIEKVKDEILQLKLAINNLNTTFNATEMEQQKSFSQKVKEEILKLKVTVNETDIEQQKNLIEKVKDEILQLKVTVNSLNTTFTNLPNVAGQESRNSNDQVMMKILDSLKTEISKLKETLSSHPSTAEMKTIEHSNGNAGVIVTNICLVIVICCLLFFIYVYYKNKHVVKSFESEHINLS